MAISFMWEIVKPERANSFDAGTSRDEQPMLETFGNTISSDRIPVLRAMHRATGRDKSLWSEIADTLGRLQGDDYETKVAIKVWTEY